MMTSWFGRVAIHPRRQGRFAWTRQPAHPGLRQIRSGELRAGGAAHRRLGNSGSAEYVAFILSVSEHTGSNPAWAPIETR